MCGISLLLKKNVRSLHVVSCVSPVCSKKKKLYMMCGFFLLLKNLQPTLDESVSRSSGLLKMHWNCGICAFSLLCSKISQNP
jgi:hypothetical protein